LAEALTALTGAPTEFVFHSDFKSSDELWNKISEADKQDFIMGCIANNLEDESRLTND
jgi:hypothetical protein